MKKLKLCLLVSITLFLSMTIQSIVFAEETSRDITTLSALGIIEGEFAPEDNLTRYELASMVVRCAKYEKGLDQGRNNKSGYRLWLCT